MKFLVFLFFCVFLYGCLGECTVNDNDEIILGLQQLFLIRLFLMKRFKTIAKTKVAIKRK